MNTVVPNNDPGKPALTEKLPDHQHPGYGKVLVAHHFIDERKMIEVLSMQPGFTQVDSEFAEINRKRLKRVAPVMSSSFLQP